MGDHLCCGSSCSCHLLDPTARTLAGQFYDTKPPISPKQAPYSGDVKPKFDQAALLKFHEDMSNASRDLMQKKNSDYSGEGDVFGNLSFHGIAGVMVRMHDKMCRVQNLLRKGYAAVDEPIEDCFRDMMNYAILAAAMYQNGMRK